MSRRRRQQKRSLKTKTVRLFKLLGVLAIIFSFILVVSIGKIIIASGEDLSSLSGNVAIEKAQTSKIYASDGTLLTDLFAEQNRVVIPLSDIPLNMQHAVVAIEDERFYEHKGVDLRAIARAVVINLREGRVVEGGSTITQQYVKNSFVTPEKTLRRKIKEASLSYQLEKNFSKQKILEKYLNTIYFGRSLYGIQTAAQAYFNKEAKDVTLEESAFLAGLIKSPNSYSPSAYPEKARRRRNTVIKKMFELGFISKEEAEKATATPLDTQPPKVKITLAPYFVEYVKQQILDNPKYGSTPAERANTLFKGGLRIYTTLDLKMQAAAEKAIAETLNKPNDPSGALVAIDPKTGYIKAMVGGKDFKTQKFNLAVQGKRQAGSSFKVFVLTAAIEKGFPPYKIYQSSPLVIKLPGKDWKVSNYTEGGGGPPMTIREATVKSVNAVFARLIMDVDAKNVVDVAKKMGITSPIDPFPSIALGGLRIGVSPLEMASAFGTLANQGIHNKPIGILKITNTKNEVIERSKKEEEQTLSQTTAYMVTDILSDVIKYGTGRKASIGRPAAGKTGTAQNYQDAWFIGYTPDLATSVWVGHPQGQIPMLRVHGIRVAGGTFPAQIWAKFMHQALAEVSPSNFTRPTKAEMVKVTVCTESNLLATRYCPTTKRRSFIKGTEPTKYCDIHQAPESVTIPNVVGMSSSQAASTLHQAGFAVAMSTQPSEAPQDQVVSQSPSGDAPAEKGSVVTIVVSTGVSPSPSQ